MTKILITLITAGVLSSAFAVDLSIDSSRTKQSNTDETISAKSSKDTKNSESKKESHSVSKDKSKAKSREVTRIESVRVKRYLKNLERKNVYPFGKCKILTKPKLPRDFNISFKDEFGIIDTYMKSILEASAQSNQFVHEEVLDFDEDTQLRFFDYINCINYYSSIEAQSYKTGKLKGYITDKEIKRNYESVQEFLADAVLYDDAKPRFNNSIDSYTFGALTVKLAYKPELHFNQIPLYSDSVYHGYSANQRRTVSITKSVKDDRTRSKDKSVNTSKSTDATLTEKFAKNKDYSFKTNFSIRNYLPK